MPYKMIEAMTGSGKTYQSIKAALLKFFLLRDCSIIVTSNLTFVDQIYNQTIELYNRNEWGRPIKELKIVIQKHTNHEQMTVALLYNLMKNESSVIIMLQHYVHDFDEESQTCAFNACLLLFLPTVHLFIDESHLLLQKTQCEYPI